MVMKVEHVVRNNISSHCRWVMLRTVSIVSLDAKASMGTVAMMVLIAVIGRDP
jgi:hypothetical protein